MAIITEITENRGIVTIITDEYTTLKIRAKHFAMMPLEIDSDVDISDYENRIAARQFSDAYEAALSALDFAAKTRVQLAQSLLRKGYVHIAVESVLDRLVENKLLDDRRIAERIAENNRSKPIGVYSLKRKLRAKGLSEEDADAALEGFDEEQQLNAAFQAAKKLYRKYSQLPRMEARNKLSQALARRGFAWDQVKEAVDCMLDSNDFNDE